MKNKSNQKTVNVIKKGISFGTCLSMVISYTAYKSIGWAIVHGCLSWIYVVYYLLKYAHTIF
ncbi:hypothetical protein PB01_16375 [Psychrobacillus glaciei]|uniref:Uncharacterized protein n=1 Tax=Psychrobacillus glaciei TaxID=2283160 RepID=A0A5J6SQI5_9BACI|nr:hypothetical protein [Psychrobacillus glaciei]QFG00259.1 hypothetical protein PB01_16375 [Psychrobacillus glaciei]